MSGAHNKAHIWVSLGPQITKYTPAATVFFGAEQVVQ